MNPSEATTPYGSLKNFLHLFLESRKNASLSYRAGRFCFSLECYFLFPRILNIFVPQTVQVPFIALRPFFISTSSVSFISLFSLHFIQCPVSATTISSAIMIHYELILTYIHSIHVLQQKSTRRLFCRDAGARGQFSCLDGACLV